MIRDVFGSSWALAYLAFTVGMVVVVLVRKRDTASALGWSLAIVLLPLLGSLLFLVFGTSHLPRRLRRKLAHRSTYAARARAGQRGPDEDEAPAWASRLGARGARLLDALGEPPGTTGNAVALLSEGEAAFERMFAAIGAARHHVHVEMYIFRHDALGRRLMALLLQKLAEGVHVRLLVDYMGTVRAWPLRRRLRRAGGEAEIFLPLLAFGKRFAPNLRNHRKIVVCDGEVAYFGGLNVGEEYVGRGPAGRPWCDLHVEVRGPAVADVQAVFVEDWDFATGRLLAGPDYFPVLPAAGSAPVRIVSGGPDRPVNPIREAWFHAVTQAERRLWIASPYVLPDAALRAALQTAARSGVDVKVITQGSPPDHYLAEWAGSYHFEELLEAGIELYRYEPGMMHAKFLLADDAVAAVGSANLDNRSLALNFEIVGVFPGADEVAAVARHYEALLARSAPIALQAFRRRSIGRKAGEALARLLSPLL